MTPHTRQRTYDLPTFLAARDAWDRGGYGPEWSDTRGMAAKAGIIFPPSGTVHDSWADDSPSQRAMVIRAIRETPRLLRWALTRPGIRDWSDVVGHLLTGRDLMALEADEREAEWLEVKRTPPMVPLTDVLGTVADSLGVER